MKKSTKERILDAGLKAWPDVRLTKVAALAGVEHTHVIYYFRVAGALKDAIAEHAVKTGNSRVILQLIAMNHKAIAGLSQADRIKHFNAVG